ncbi:MAG TPA: glycosyltransferase family 2 protein [Thermoanaerobaculia bacterium]|jgi:glycosyltransferase involved in cell wall biosynthesis
MPDFDVIIPARDEEPTVAGVVRAARGAAGVGRVIVVDDGSSDGTAEEASRAGATVIRARQPGEPGSKAQALARGVEASDAPVLVFFDADIVDVQPVHFEALAAPVLSGEVSLSCGIVDYGALRNPLFLRLPPITGLRALPREIFAAVPESKRNGFQIEIMINEVVVRRGLPSAIRVLAGLRHRSKIEKRGWRQGLPSHLAMTRELLACLRIVPLWTYGAYLRKLRILPPAVAGAPRPAALREAESSVPGTSP